MSALRYFVVLSLVLTAGAARAAEESQSLFDGKTLAGWEGDPKFFRVDDGAIVAGSLDHAIPHNVFLASEKEFGDFELRVKFKITGAGANAGVQFRSRRVPNDFEVAGYQADLGDTWYGSLYDESRRNKLLVTADKAAVDKVIDPKGWNQYVIRAQGKHIQLWINDLKTCDYEETDDKIEQRGIIALQIHGGGPSEARYKDIEIEKLD